MTRSVSITACGDRGSKPVYGAAMTLVSLSRMNVLKLAVPVMLAQAAIAATGIVDMIVMGLSGSKTDLAGVAVASVTFSFIYWGFGFLRMSTTGLVAQATGAGQRDEAVSIVQRALLLGLTFGLALLVLSPFLKSLVFQPFGAEAEVERLAEDYFSARIWGAPALLMSYGISGYLLAKGRTGALLAYQIFMNLVNAALDIWFVLGLGWGLTGIAAGTAIAEWAALFVGLFLISDTLRLKPGLLDRGALWAMFSANRDILIRTLALLFCFAWFTRSGAMMGTAQLAGNEVLLQFITVSAFVLDGFAFVAEKEVGEAFGAKDRARLTRAMRITTELALGFGALISALYLIGGAFIIETVIADAEARHAALAFLPFCAIVPLLGVPAWQLDGFFLGATRGTAIRTAGIVMAAAYVTSDIILRPQFGNAGVWSAFLLMYVFRAISLAVFLPDFFRAASSGPHPQRQ